MAPVPSKNIKSSPVKDPLQEIQPSKSSVSHMLFVHRQSLGKTKTGGLSKACTKLQLTEKLISNTVKNAHKCTPDELETLNRETIFKMDLKRNIVSTKFCRSMQLEKTKQQQIERTKKYFSSQETEPQPADSNSNDSIAMEVLEQTDHEVDALAKGFLTL